MRGNCPKSVAPHLVRITRLSVLALTLAICLVHPTEAAQQSDATPVDPLLCQVNPRPLPLWDGTPAAIDHAAPPDQADAEPADEATIRGITGTVIESLACANAGQPLRALALVTDDFLARQFTGPDAADVTESGALLSRPENPPLDTEQLGLVSIEEVVVYGDGSVGARVVTAGSGVTYEDYVVFVEGEDRWLIDASFPLDQDGGTPAA